MRELQRIIYNRLKTDSALWALLGLGVSPSEAAIASVILPVPPNRPPESAQIYFRFPPSVPSFRNTAWEFRPIEFRIWTSDISLGNQQDISNRIQELFCNWIFVWPGVTCSTIRYISEGGIPGVIGELYGWCLEMELGNEVKHFTQGG